jgi:hypothetical protein
MARNPAGPLLAGSLTKPKRRAEGRTFFKISILFASSSIAPDCPRMVHVVSSSETLPALWGLWVDHLNKGELQTALELAHRFACIVTNSAQRNRSDGGRSHAGGFSALLRRPRKLEPPYRAHAQPALGRMVPLAALLAQPHPQPTVLRVHVLDRHAERRTNAAKE